MEIPRLRLGLTVVLFLLEDNPRLQTSPDRKLLGGSVEQGQRLELRQLLPP